MCNGLRLHVCYGVTPDISELVVSLFSLLRPNVYLVFSFDSMLMRQWLNGNPCEGFVFSFMCS
jgi:hypothetical protein